MWLKPQQLTGDKRLVWFKSLAVKAFLNWGSHEDRTLKNRWRMVECVVGASPYLRIYTLVLCEDT